MSVTPEQYLDFSTGAMHADKSFTQPGEYASFTGDWDECEIPEHLSDIDPDFPQIAKRVFETRTKLSQNLERLNNDSRTAPPEPSQSHQSPSPAQLEELQRSISASGINSDPQNCYGARKQPPWNMADAMMQQFGSTAPTVAENAAPQVPYTNMQYMAPGPASALGSWDPVYPNKYDASHVGGGFIKARPHAHNGGPAFYVSTTAVSGVSPPNAHMPSTLFISSQESMLNASNVESGVPNSAKSAGRKRGLSPERRTKVRKLRKMGACIRCRTMKVSCDEGNPCTKCIEVLGNARTFLEPCTRDNLGNVVMVRQGNSEFDQEIMAFRDYDWKCMVATKPLQLQWCLPDGYSTELPNLVIECHEYVPRKGDVTAAKWQENGRVTTVLLPTYACKDQAKLLQMVGDFLDTGRNAVEIDMMGQITDELERLTFQEAYRHREQSNLILLALRIRANTILSAGWGTPVGDESLGIPEIVGGAAGQVGDRPLPPAIDHQIDVAIWEIIRKDQESLIKALKKKLFQQPGRKPWLEIFLTFFVSLSNVQYVHGRAMAWNKSQQQTDTAYKVTYQVKKMIEKWNYSAQNILHHFRSIFRGDLPLVAAEKDLGEFAIRESLDSQSKNYIQRVLSILRAEGESFFRQTISTELGDHWTRHMFIQQYQRSG